MDNNALKAFIAVCTYHNISKAAASLYISQSNLSARIARLEQDLGFRLFIRQRGKHNVELTPKGELFLQYARQIENAMNDIENLSKEPDRSFLSIGANTGTHQFTLKAFYQDFMKRHPDICLGLHTYHSSDIYNYVMAGRFELGIVSNPKQVPEISTKLIYEEPLFIAARRDSPYYNGIMPHELPGNQEIFLAYNREYTAWHEQFWPNRQYYMRLSDAYDLPSFMTDPGRWAFVSASTAIFFMKTFDCSIFSTGFETPTSHFYLVEKKNKYRSEAAETYKKELFAFIQDNINLICRI
ncbi:MAG: LysR family transcriptional regulator [Bulleidia sp.]